MTLVLENIEDVKKIFRDIKTPVFYVANNSDKGVGLEKIISDYHIVCIDYYDEVEYLKDAGVDIFCLEKQKNEQNVIFRNSGLLMKEKEVIDYIGKHGGDKPAIMIFKPSVMIEKICKKNNWTLLSNSYSSSEKFENKMEFYKIAESLGLPIPKTREVEIGKIAYKDLQDEFGNFVIQLGKGFAGSTTTFINSEEDYLKFKKTNKSEKVKISQFICGVSLTVNACVTKFGTVVGEPCYQITGEKSCTNSAATTCGTDWEIYRKKWKMSYGSIADIVRKVGDYLKSTGYKGIFGLDLIFEAATGKIYLIECNSRLVASIPMATKLEIAAGKIPLLALHLLEFLGADYQIKNMELEKQGKDIQGAQLVLRNIEGKKCVARGEFRSGVYKIEGNKAVFVRKGYSTDDILGEGEFVVLTVSKNSIVSAESECAKIKFNGSFLDDNYHLKEWARSAVAEIYRGLQLV